jgi:hypothetical protein
MAKLKSKKQKKGQRAPNISPSTLLRPRLDALWHSETMPTKELSMLQADLDAVAKDVRPDVLVPVMLTAYLEAPEQSQEHLIDVVPRWLNENDYCETLKMLVTGKDLDYAQEQQALAWLEACGQDIDELDIPTAEDYFYRAFFFNDEDDQGSLMIFWYSNRTHSRARGLICLIDNNPPWDGSIKDTMITPQRSPDDLIVEFVENMSAGLSSPMEEINGVEAKIHFIEALQNNRKAEIRLSKDTAMNRESIISHVLELPDGEEIPEFSVEDFDELCEHGEPAEDLMRFERTVGRRIRGPEGEELFVPAEDANNMMGMM